MCRWTPILCHEAHRRANVQSHLKPRGKPLHFGLLSIFSHICYTMAYVHSKGIVHLDLKPSNIMVGDYDRVRVIDWGLARRIGSPELEVTEHEFRMGYALQLRCE
ncbi:MAG: protein kinase [Pirellulaceae bacterium]